MQEGKLHLDERAVIEEALRIASEVLGDQQLDEKGKSFYYDTANEKRWVTDGDPCEICESNEELGWIADEDVFQGVFGDIDDDVAHPNCMCTVEYRERRYRVYESGERVMESERLTHQRAAAGDYIREKVAGQRIAK